MNAVVIESIHIFKFTETRFPLTQCCLKCPLPVGLMEGRPMRQNPNPGE